GVPVLVLDDLFLKEVFHLAGDVFRLRWMRDDVEFFFLLWGFVRLGRLALFSHLTLTVQGSEQSRINPQLRQISLQCTSSIGKPQMSQSSPSGGATEGRSAQLAPAFSGSPVRRSRLIM